MQGRIDELREEGIAAARAGQRAKSRALLAEVVRQRSGDITAWIWLAHVLDDPARKRYCLEHVLQLDPSNRAARLGLAQMKDTETAPPAAPRSGGIQVRDARARPAAGAASAAAKPVPSSPQVARKGSPAAAAFAALICFLDGLLLLAVAMMQISEGDGLSVVIGVWNLLVTGLYIVIAGGLAARKEWSYGWGLGVALVNIGLLFSQVTFWGALGASEESLYPAFVLIVGDIVLAVTLWAMKNAIAPAPKPQEIATPSSLISELDGAVRGGTSSPTLPEPTPSVPVPREPATIVPAGLVTPGERDHFVAVRKAFIANQSKRRLVQAKTGIEVEGEHIDLIVRDWSGTVMTLGRAASQRYVYLFRPVVDKDLVQWMKRTVWKKEPGFTAIIAIVASQQAVETCGGGFFDTGTVGIYALRDGARCKKRKGRNCVAVFEKWYKKNRENY